MSGDAKNRKSITKRAPDPAKPKGAPKPAREPRLRRASPNASTVLLGKCGYQRRLFRSGSHAIHRRRLASGVSGALTAPASFATTGGRFSAATKFRNALGLNR
jgi:hypothetical protein